MLSCFDIFIKFVLVGSYTYLVCQSYWCTHYPKKNALFRGTYLAFYDCKDLYILGAIVVQIYCKLSLLH